MWLQHFIFMFAKYEGFSFCVSSSMLLFLYLFIYIELQLIYNLVLTSGVCGYLPWWLSSKESACQHRRHGFHPWLGNIPWRRKWLPTPVFLPGKKSHKQRILVGCSPQGCKESNMTQRLNNSVQLYTHTHTHTYIFFRFSSIIGY